MFFFYFQLSLFSKTNTPICQYQSWGCGIHIDYLLDAAPRRRLPTGDYIRRGHHQILYFLLCPTDSNRNLKWQSFPVRNKNLMKRAFSPAVRQNKDQWYPKYRYILVEQNYDELSPKGHIYLLFQQIS